MQAVGGGDLHVWHSVIMNSLLQAAFVGPVEKCLHHRMGQHVIQHSLVAH